MQIASKPQFSQRHPRESKAFSQLQSVKSQLQDQISYLQNFKQSIIAMSHSSEQTKVRLQIESLVIELNEEMFKISETLASYLEPGKVDHLKEHDLRKKAEKYERRL
jgi:hypothetical protein